MQLSSIIHLIRTMISFSLLRPLVRFLNPSKDRPRLACLHSVRRMACLLRYFGASHQGSAHTEHCHAHLKRLPQLLSTLKNHMS